MGLKLYNLLRLPGTYAAIIDVSINNSVTRTYLKNLRGVFFYMVGHLVKKLPVRFFKYGLVTELLRPTCKGGSDFIYFSSIYTW